MNASKQPSFSPRQQGAVLVFSLVSLLLLTLLSVNMIQQNRLQFMMAANAQQQTETFAAAEDLLALTETQVDTWHATYSQECRQSPKGLPTQQGATICRNNGDQVVNCFMPDNTTPNPAARTATATYRYTSCYNTTTTKYDTKVLDNLDLNFSWPWPGTPDIPNELYRCYTTGSKYTQLQADDVGAAAPPPWTVATNTLGLAAAEIGTTTVRIVSVACLTDTGVEEVCKYNNDGTLSSDNLYCNSTNQANCPTELYTLQIVTQNANTSAQRTVESKYAVRCDAWAGELPTP